ncbi:MAG: electron transport complex subunit RsxC [Spirochaetales bacterium]|uniref:Ion-translocating oxidoreductase complex subunit C n=1 Tax=Candidatus Thalassospirochaeta sargassi TaxID=3119039 RepID=A0AAJ1IDS8_9SPIO|nr:electron transport complex subunit RsxC [Spirochaetales bacterium]
MKGLKTFSRGGIHPHGRKNLTNKKEIVTADIPETLIVPMAQHLGAPAEVVVAAGDEIKEGMLIGKPAGFISAAVHSPVSGTVKEITDVYLANGMKSSAVVIEKEEGFIPAEKTKSDSWKSKTPQELIEIVKDSGVVGLGGATFPANVKYMVPKGEKAEYLIINAVECEPYLSADHRLMLEKASELIEGLRIISKMVEPEKVAIGIEINKPDAIEIMRKQAEAENFDLEVVPLKLKYPQGDEKQLIKAVTGREVPSGGLPIAVGCVVSNVGTVNAVYEAVALGKPLYERTVSVTGLGVKNPGNFLTRVGTPISSLLEACGGIIDNPAKVVVGGPMMGFSIYDLDTPVTKGTSGILILTDEESGSGSRTACLSCGRCVSVCPMGLNPTKMFKFVDHDDYDSAMQNNLMDCKECGCCAYACPANIPLVQGMRLGKKMARKKKVS